MPANRDNCHNRCLTTELAFPLAMTLRSLPYTWQKIGRDGAYSMRTPLYVAVRDASRHVSGMCWNQTPPRPPHTALFDLPCHSESNCDPVIVGARFGRRSGGAGLRRVVNSAPTGEGLR